MENYCTQYFWIVISGYSFGAQLTEEYLRLFRIDFFIFLGTTRNLQLCFFPTKTLSYLVLWSSKKCVETKYHCENDTTDTSKWSLSKIFDFFPPFLGFKLFYKNHQILIFKQRLISHDDSSQLTFTCSRSIIDTLERGVKYVQS